MHTEMTAVEGKTAVTPNVVVMSPDSVARRKSLHFMLTIDIILNSGQGEGYESWRRLFWNTILVPGCVQQAL